MVILRAILGALLLLALLLPAPGAAAPRTEVIVELDVAPLVGARGLAARGRALAIEAATRRLEARILAAVPSAEVRWRYRRVLAGLAVVVPAGEAGSLERLPGVAAVYPSVRYEALLSSSPGQIGAPGLWGPRLEGSAGRGMKIGIIDDGIDPSHTFFDPAGFEPPPGFPKGDARFTTAKVIVARAFAPPGLVWRNAGKPFDPVYSSHGTHVAGIAAGNAGTVAPADGGRPALVLSGVAPLAYIGNYKALTVPTAGGVGLNGNSPELVAAVEAAVEDGMDVINLSLGQFEVAPERDALAKALDNAAAAGVVATVSAGNQFQEFGRGSVMSPASAVSAIAVAAATGTRAFGVRASVTGPGDVPPELQAFGGLPSADSLTAESEPLVDVRALGVDERLCDRGSDPDRGRPPLAPGSLTGKTALVRRGGCELATKIGNITDAGGVGAVVADDGSGSTAGFQAPFALPVLFVSKDTGDRLAALATEEPEGTIFLSVGREAAAVEVAGGAVADYSASGPTAFGLELKPDVVAPGDEILSASPTDSSFEIRSGTSMAAPHVAGAAALLLERHPEWTVEHVKSALVTTGRPVWVDAARRKQAPSARQGGGLVDLVAADSPILFASPQGLAFGLLDVSAGARTTSLTLELADAGGGAGAWSVAVVDQAPGGGARIVAPSSATVPGDVTLTAKAAANATERDRTGFVVLTRDGVSRRVPFWFRVTRSRLDDATAKRLRGPGTYSATTAGGAALVTRYRYPERTGLDHAALPGPERVFRFTLTRPAANFGVAVLSTDPDVAVEPRIVAGADENRLLGPTALPSVANPYLARFLEEIPVSAALLPAPGLYSLVFDSPSQRAAGRFTFRFWVNDVTPPRIALLTDRGRLLTARVTDAGSGVDPRSVVYALDGGNLTPARYDAGSGLATIHLARARAGRHRLVIQASDYQETKNTENIPGVLPNTTVLRTTVTVP